ncbi:MAG: hypothetical protein JWO13_139 [Acidobacteriales bacterium]|nr:hypothetical protein [Terriglobales bacterium]
MKFRLGSRLLAVVLIQAVLCADALAIRANPVVQAPESIKFNRLLGKLGEGTDSLVAVRLKDKSALAGYLAEINKDSFLLVDTKTGAENRVAYSQINRLQGVNLQTGAQVSHGLGIRGKLVKALTLLVPGRRVQRNGLFGTSALLIGIVIGIILAIVLTKSL